MALSPFSTFCLFSACSVIVHTVLRTVDVGAAIGDVAAHNRFMVGAMMRIRTAAMLVAFAGTFVLPAAGARAQTAPQGMRPAQASQPAATDVSAQRRTRRPTTRLRVYPQYEWVPDVYPRYNPGPNAVRECNATYVQEYRPSGTVIVPHMSCYWRRG
jgi:lipoprotein-anchoring transpeptidase ErfK/SrfK